MTKSAPRDELPEWRSVLAVVAHPDDESFGLGAVIARLVADGSTVSVLCFTHGEASTLHGVEGDLAVVRAAELVDASDALDVSNVRLSDFPDGGLASVSLERLTAQVVQAAEQDHAEGLLVFDAGGVTGHPDHVRATQAALAGASALGLGVLGWTLPGDVATTLSQEFGATFVGHDEADVDIVVGVRRDEQLVAIGRHPSQAIPTSVVWRRLELQQGYEHLRWLRPPYPADR